MFHYVISYNDHLARFGDMLSRTKPVTYYDIWLPALIKTTEKFYTTIKQVNTAGATKDAE
jgi:hypothetical protein